MPSQGAMEKAMGSPSKQWAGKCHAAAIALADLLGPETATVRRGYFVGKTTTEAYFHHRFAQHSWVELRDGRVADPTRFAFVGGNSWPIWIGDDEDYDIGGCRTCPPSGPPPDLLDTTRELVELNLGSVEYVADLLGQEPIFYGGLEEGDPWITVSVEQLYWLANLPVKDKEGPGILARWFAAEVYEAICEAGHSAAIPIDRQDWILPERSKGRSSF